MARNSEIYERGAFTFPGGRTKAVILSFDDGLVQDRRLVELLDRHELKGTFHLVSGFLGTHDDWLIEFTGEPAEYLPADEIRTLFTRHEVSSHSVSHPALTTIDDAEVLRQVNEDRRTLSRLSGRPVDSHAYPFGAHDERIVSLLAGTSLLAARTVDDSGSFALPEDLLQWAPTTHHLGALPHIDRFLALEDAAPAVLFIWGHSWEFDIGEDGNDWALIEAIVERLGARDDLWSAGLGEAARYLLTVRALEQGPSGWVNPGDVSVWIRTGESHERLDPAAR